MFPASFLQGTTTETRGMGEAGPGSGAGRATRKWVRASAFSGHSRTANRFRIGSTTGVFSGHRISSQERMTSNPDR